MKTDEYHAIFEASPHPMWVLDQETGKFLDINQAAIRIYGYSRAEFLALRIGDIRLTSEAPAPGRPKKTLLPPLIVSRHRRKDGSDFFAETSTGKLLFRGRRALIVTAIDVTARVEAEQRTHDTETKFRAFFEMSPDASGLARGGVHVLVNPAYAEMFGYRSPEELEGIPVLDVFAAFERPRIAEYIRLGQDGRGAPPAYQAHGLRRDGSQFEMDVRISQFAEGRELYSVFVLRDVSPLLRANEALEHHRRRLAEAHKIASLGNWEVNLDTNELVWSDEIFQIFGLDPNGTTPSRSLFYECVHPDDRIAVREAVDRAIREHESYAIEHRVIRPDGVVHWVHERGEVLTGGGSVRLAGTVQDITARRESEERLRLLESVVVCGHDAVMICAIEPPHTIVYVNPAFTEIYQYDSEEVKGKSLDLLAGAKTEPSVVRQIWRDIGAGRHGSVELTHYRKDGSDCVAELTYQRIIEPTGKLAHVAFVARDVTERRRLEAQFRQSQKMEAIGRLAGGVAHDFNNLLLIIAGYAHMLREGFPASDPTMEAIDQISKAADRAAALTRQLLIFSRRQDIRRQVVDVNHIVANLEKMLRRVIGEDVELRIHAAEREALVRTDSNQIDQVLMNLAVNARDAMPEGGVLTIAVDTQPQENETHYGISGPMVRMTVSDTGVGMDPETKSHIFEPFFTTKAEGAGTGLGLSTVYAIVKQNDGEIFVESAPGEGTTFEIVLPVARTGEESAAPVRPGASPGGTETILLTEDDAGVRKLIAAMLRRGGYTVLEAALPAQALDLLKQSENVQLLLTDIVMPGMSGWALAARALKLRPHLKVVYMSGYTDHAAVQEDSVEGANILRKPFTMEVLHAAVRQTLGARRVMGRP
jgi:PAS domain S-box-containing protein